MPAVDQFNTADSNMAGLITVAIRREMIPRLRNKLVFAPYAAKGKLQVHGQAKTLRWNLLSDIGVFTTPLTEDSTTNTTENQILTLTVSSVLMTVSDYGAFMKQSDLSDSVWSEETRSEFSSIFAFSGAKTADTLLRNVADDSTNYFVAGQTQVNTGTMTGGTSKAIAQDLNVIRGFFNQNDAEPFDSLGGNYMVAIPGKVEQDMVGDVTTNRLSWSPLIQHVSEGVSKILNYKGPGMLLGMAVLRTNNIGTVVLTTSSTPLGSPATGATAYICIALAEYGIGNTTLDQAEPRIIIKRPGPQSLSVPLDTYSTIGWKMRMAPKNIDSLRSLVYYASAT